MPVDDEGKIFAACREGDVNFVSSQVPLLDLMSGKFADNCLGAAFFSGNETLCRLILNASKAEMSLETFALLAMNLPAMVEDCLCRVADKGKALTAGFAACCGAGCVSEASSLLRFACGVDGFFSEAGLSAAVSCMEYESAVWVIENVPVGQEFVEQAFIDCIRSLRSLSRADLDAASEFVEFLLCNGVNQDSERVLLDLGCSALEYCFSRGKEKEFDVLLRHAWNLEPVIERLREIDSSGVWFSKAKAFSEMRKLGLLSFAGTRRSLEGV